MASDSYNPSSCLPLSFGGVEGGTLQMYLSGHPRHLSSALWSAVISITVSSAVERSLLDEARELPLPAGVKDNHLKCS